MALFSLTLLRITGGHAQAGEPGYEAARLTHDGLDKQRPSWSPGGDRLLFARHEADGSGIRLYVLLARDGAVAEGTRPQRLLEREVKVEYNATFAPNGSSVLFASISLSGTQGNVDLARVGADGSGFEVVVGDQDGKLAHQDWPSWSPDGKRFAFQSTHEGNQEIYVADADGSNVVRITQHPGHDAHPCWSPDRSRIAFATDRWGGLELASVGPDGTGLVRLTTSPGLDDYPSYSPDGSTLAFVSHRDGNYEVYVSKADGSSPRNLTGHPGRDVFPTWTPNGRGVTFVSDRARGADLYTIEVGDGPG